MNSQEMLEVAPGGCCCRSASPGGLQGEGCDGKITVLTGREEKVLTRIREASERVRELRREEAGLTGRAGSGEERERISLELNRLRKLRVELEEERLAAADERMRILGHL
jgi:hypothetical protein